MSELLFRPADNLENVEHNFKVLYWYLTKGGVEGAGGGGTVRTPVRVVAHSGHSTSEHVTIVDYRGSGLLTYIGVVKNGSANLNLRITTDDVIIFQSGIRSPTSATGRFYPTTEIPTGIGAVQGLQLSQTDGERGRADALRVSFSRRLLVEFRASSTSDFLTVMYEKDV